MYRFRDSFGPVEHIPNSPSVAFHYRSRIADDLLRDAYSFDSFDEDEREAAFRHSLSLVSEETRPMVAAARVGLFVHIGDLDRAKFEIRKLKTETALSPPRVRGEVKGLERWIAEHEP
jgi:hypothetical protein